MVPAQLSVVVGIVTVAEHSPVTVAKVGTAGAVTSFTVTVKVSVSAVPQPLDAVAVTVVVPTGNE